MIVGKDIEDDMNRNRATVMVDAMKGTPVLLAFLLIIAGFLVFFAYMQTKVDAREKSHLGLISELVKECRGAKP
jgi:ABC-type amino acid transport system permease subunit